MMGTISEKISIEKVLTAIGVASLRVVDPLDQAAAVDAVKAAAGETGVRAIIFRSPCVAVVKPSPGVSGERCLHRLRQVYPRAGLSGGGEGCRWQAGDD